MKTGHFYLGKKRTFLNWFDTPSGNGLDIPLSFLYIHPISTQVLITITPAPRILALGMEVAGRRDRAGHPVGK
jgi:hypothetical protein